MPVLFTSQFSFTKNQLKPFINNYFYRGVSWFFFVFSKRENVLKKDAIHIISSECNQKRQKCWVAPLDIPQTGAFLVGDRKIKTKFFFLKIAMTNLERKSSPIRISWQSEKKKNKRSENKIARHIMTRHGKRARRSIDPGVANEEKKRRRKRKEPHNKRHDSGTCRLYATAGSVTSSHEYVWLDHTARLFIFLSARCVSKQKC